MGNYYEVKNTTGNIGTSGSIGAGTLTPGNKLHIITSVNDGIKLSDGTTTGIIFPSTTLTNSLAIGTQSNHPIIFGTNNIFPALTIDISQRVGIGTSSPNQLLEVYGGGWRLGTQSGGTYDGGLGGGFNQANNIYSMFFRDRTDTSWNDAWVEAKTITLKTGTPAPAAALTIDASRKVGIDCSPITKFQIHGSTNENLGVLGTGSASVKITAFNDAGNANIPMLFDASDYTFQVAGSDKVKIDSSGNLAIGSSFSGNGALNVNGDIKVGGGNRSIGNYGNNSLSLRTNDTDRLEISAAGDITVANAGLVFVKNSGGVALKALRASTFGYASSYQTLIVGDSGSGSQTICLGYDPVGNSSGSFAGDGRDILLRNDARIITPTAANTGFYNPHLVFKDGNIGIRVDNPADRLTVRIDASDTGITLTDNGSNYNPLFQMSRSGTVRVKATCTSNVGNIYGNGGLNLGGALDTNHMTIASNGYLTAPGVYTQTSASLPNVFVDSSGNLMRSTAVVSSQTTVQNPTIRTTTSSVFYATNNNAITNSVTVKFPDGNIRTVTESNLSFGFVSGKVTKFRAGVLTNAADWTTVGQCSGYYSGITPGTNQWYCIYAVKSTYDASKFVLVADQVAPVWVNESTLSTRYGTNSWVYLGTICYPSITVLQRTVGQEVQLLSTTSTALPIMASSAGAGSTSWNPGVGFTFPDLPDHITPSLTQVYCQNPANNVNFYVSTAAGETYLHDAMLAGASYIAMIPYAWTTGVYLGVTISVGTCALMRIQLARYTDTALNKYLGETRVFEAV